jgi:hypothetical protein
MFWLVRKCLGEYQPKLEHFAIAVAGVQLYVGAGYIDSIGANALKLLLLPKPLLGILVVAQSPIAANTSKNSKKWRSHSFLETPANRTKIPQQSCCAVGSDKSPSKAQ